MWRSVGKNVVVSALCGIQDAISKLIQGGWWCLRIVHQGSVWQYWLQVKLKMGPRPDDADDVKDPVLCV